MKLNEVKKIAKVMGLETARVTKEKLVRTIQLEEGNDPCFGTGRATECGQQSCLWREDCN
jgi:hypothetical protein